MAKRIVFFNNKGGVGKTTMVYHLAYMLRELGYKVLVADLDPQTNLTAMFLEQKRLEEIFLGTNQMLTITDLMRPVIEGEGYKGVYVEPVQEGLYETSIHLLLGNLALSAYEDKLSSSWAACVDRDPYSFKVVSLFHRIMTDATKVTQADFVLIDVGPNLGAINRAVLIASDYVILPVGSDLFSLQGIKNLGITLKNWRAEWEDRKGRNPKPEEIRLPEGKMQAVGYITTQHTAKENRPVNAYLRWSNRIPQTYKEYILGQPNNDLLEVEQDPHCLGMIRHYHSLMPMAMEAKKPIFSLKPADGAIGAHFQATQKVYKDFKKVTEKIIAACQ
ncbi:ParA family protein [Hugenholtzia roseola]|uniref:ParA family protein n=1 Tax=Hugenholtzia roseola TaxID=1002 RepID=UPI000404D5B7|nr:AAA family ATPase [Hugenholtzia roseola]